MVFLTPTPTLMAFTAFTNAHGSSPEAPTCKSFYGRTIHNSAFRCQHLNHRNLVRWCLKFCLNV